MTIASADALLLRYSDAGYPGRTATQCPGRTKAMAADIKSPRLAPRTHCTCVWYLGRLSLLDLTKNQESAGHELFRMHMIESGSLWRLSVVHGRAPRT